MKLLLIILLLCTFYLSNAQLTQVDWLRSVKGSQYEQISAIAQAPCGAIYAVGYYQGTLSNFTATAGEDAFFAKYSQDGQLIWLKNLNSTSTDRFSAVEVINDHEIYLAGEFKETLYYGSDSLVSQNQMDALLVKIDSSGAVQWMRRSGGMGYESIISVAASANGNLTVTGYFEQDFQWDTLLVQSKGLRDIFVASVRASDGRADWLTSLGGPATDQPKSVAVDALNNTYVSGSFRDALFVASDTILSKGSYDVFVAKFDPTGALAWLNTFGGFSVDEGACVGVDALQHVYVTGWFDRSLFVDSVFVIGGQEENAMLVKFDASGNFLWVRDIGQNFDERAYALDFDAQNNVYVIGTLDSFVVLGQDTLSNRHLNRPTDIFLAKYSQEGDLFWARDFGYYYNDFCFDLLVENEHTIYIAGAFQDSTIFVNDTIVSEADGFDFFIAKLAIDTNLSLPALPAVLSQVRSFPNPSTASFNLEYELEQSADISIRLIDGQGRSVLLFDKKHQQAGLHRFEWHKSTNTKGLYFIQLLVGKMVFTLPHIFLE